MALCEVAIDLDELEPHDLETPLLEAGDDLADKLALHAVRLHENESALGHFWDTPAVD